MAEIQPDKETNCKRYGMINIGGDEYRVPRMSLGHFGDKLRGAVDAVKDKEGQALIDAFYDVFRIAMSRFYSDERVESLLDSGNVGFEEVGEIIAIATGSDTEKKSSADVS